MVVAKFIRYCGGLNCEGHIITKEFKSKEEMQEYYDNNDNDKLVGYSEVREDNLVFGMKVD